MVNKVDNKDISWLVPFFTALVAMGFAQKIQVPCVWACHSVNSVHSSRSFKGCGCSWFLKVPDFALKALGLAGGPFLFLVGEKAVPAF